MNRLFHLAVAAAMGATAAMAASAINIQGTASGSFSGAPGLSFSPTAFNVTTDNTGAYDDLTYGSFSASCGGFCNDNSGTFTVHLTFTVPAGITTGENPATATADVSGNVNILGGQALISFYPNQSPINITYSNAAGHGGFTISFDTDDNVTVGDYTGSQAAVLDISNASFTPSAVPEPTVTLLFGTMLVGVLFTARKGLSRKSNLS